MMSPLANFQPIFAKAQIGARTGQLLKLIELSVGQTSWQQERPTGRLLIPPSFSPPSRREKRILSSRCHF